MPDNEALWLPAKGAAFRRGPAPYTRPKANEVVVRNRAVAVNPVDRMIPAIGGLILPWLRYPAILGSDVAGDVVEVGSAVTRFKVGDRVLGHAVGVEKARNAPSEGAFQLFTVLLDHMATPIPQTVTYEQACVLPLGLSTAACGLFQSDLLALRWPTAPGSGGGETVIVWGASTSVGSNAIQLAVAAGYRVIATASPHNFAHATRLGASAVFDYRSPTVVRDIASRLQGDRVAGALAIGVGSTGPCMEILGTLPGRRFVAVASPPIAFDTVPSGRGRLIGLARVLPRIAGATLALRRQAKRLGVQTRMIWGGALLGNEIGPMIYRDFLERALAEGRYLAAPEPLVVGDGLDQVPEALEQQRRGVSARKLVVRL
ncbi:MAG: zinc-binding alcohol dehydrogenase family protein [Paracoccaceae bacterium]|nr:zinc-binding alcohol dehydrogenase family protein [Paracoccaceae bacterium]